MNKLRIVMLAAAVMLGLGANAQNGGLYFPQSNGDYHVQCVKISTKSIFRQCPTLSYEHTIGNKRGSVEGTLGWFTSGESNHLQGALVKAGYKWTFAMGKKSKDLLHNRYLCSGFYIKPELSYVRRSRWYESFTYNDGWDMYFDNLKYSENNLALMLQMGFQVNWTHFFLEYTFGLGKFWSGDVFHQEWSYAYTAWGTGDGICAYNTLKLGFPF